jgi:diguanylate cyclase (GGDEF)-like protein
MVQLEYTPFIWPFVASLVITMMLGIYAYRRRHLPAASIFAMVMLALVIWTFCYIMELSSVTLEGKIFWASAKYFGASSGPVAWFILALHLTKNDHWLTTPVQMALWAFAIITCFVVFTNDFHHWFWTNIYLVEGFPETQSEHGFFFWVYAAIVYSFILTSVILFFQYYRTTPAFYRRQALLLALGGFVPLGGRILEDFFKIDLFPKVDNVILLFLLSGMLFAIAIFRYSALHIVHIGHNLVIQNISAGIIVLDMFERVVELNPYAKALMRSTDAPTIGKPLHEILDGWPQLAITPGAEQEVAVPYGAGERCFQLQSSQIKAENGAPAGYAVVLFDITARKHAERQLAALARTDPLTGITNRRHFYELAEAEFARARRYQRPLAIMMFDIDHFKQINDTYGHLVGDEAIKFVAAECQRHLRTTDILARYGGEEFICLLDEGNQADACRIAERVRHVIAESRLNVDQQTIQMTISIGIASLHNREMTLSDLINQADQALYASKSNGRNQVRVWGADSHCGVLT